MNNPLIKLLLIGLLMLMVVAPFAGLAPLMLLLLAVGVGWFIWSLVEVFLLLMSKKSRIRVRNSAKILISIADD